MKLYIDALFPDEKDLNNQFLYHYTNIAAVISIMESKNLRLMDYNIQNDSTEGKYFLDKLNYKSNTEKAKTLLLKNYYLCSFSSFGNLLSQWRGYGDINIGFDYSGLKYASRYITDKNNCHSLDTSGTQFMECQYLSEEDTEYQRIVDQSEDIIRNIKFDDISNTQYNLLKLGEQLFSCKHSGFFEENECRIISFLWNKDPFKIRECKKYIEYDFDPNIIKRIVISPSSNQDKNYKEIMDFIEKNPEYQNVDVYISNIPFINSTGNSMRET